MKWLNKSGYIFDRVIGGMAFLAAIILVFVLLSVCLEVVLRYFFNRPTIWVVELSEYSMLFLAFLTAAWLLKEEGHVKIDVVLTQVKPGTQAILTVITSILAAIACVIVAWYVGKIAWVHLVRWDLTPTLLRLPKGALMSIIPIGSFLLFIQFLRRTYKYFGIWRASPDKEQEM